MPSRSSFAGGDFAGELAGLRIAGAEQARMSSFRSAAGGRPARSGLGSAERASRPSTSCSGMTRPADRARPRPSRRRPGTGRGCRRRAAARAVPGRLPAAAGAGLPNSGQQVVGRARRRRPRGDAAAARRGPSVASPADLPLRRGACAAAADRRRRCRRRTCGRIRRRLGRPSLTSSCGRPGVSAIQSARPRIGGRGAGGPGGAEKIAARSARLEMPARSTKPPRLRDRLGDGAAHRRQAILDERVASRRPARRNRRARSRGRRSSSRPGARRARCPRGDAARRARRRTRRRGPAGAPARRRASAGSGGRPRSTDGTSTPAKRELRRTPRSAPGDEQEAPRRRVEIGVEPAVAEGARCACSPSPSQQVPGLDEVGLEAARREVAERRQLAVPAGDSRDVARDVHALEAGLAGAATASPGTGTAGSPSGGTD